MSGNNKNKSPLLLITLLIFTLGLAPYFPEPHLWGKLKWIAGGSNGMQAIDWFDFIFHLSPFLILFIYLIRKRKT